MLIIAMAASLATYGEVMVRLVRRAYSVFLPTALSGSGPEVIASRLALGCAARTNRLHQL